MQLNAALGRDRDVTISFETLISSAIAGTGADLEQPVFVNPDLSLAYSPSAAAGASGGAVKGNLAMNHLQLRQMALVPQAALTAAATNTFDWRVNVWRNGALQGAIAWYPAWVATTITPATTAGSVQTVAVASANGLRAGATLPVDTAGNQEWITLLGVAGNNITAFFSKAHAGGVALNSNLVPFRPINLVPMAGGVAAAATIPVITAGANVVVTPIAVAGASGMLGIHVGDQLTVADAGLTETVTVSAVTNTTFTATFANSHAAGKAISTALLGNASQSAIFTIQGGDVITFARVSAGTGLASPQVALVGDYAPSVSPMGR